MAKSITDFADSIEPAECEKGGEGGGEGANECDPEGVLGPVGGTGVEVPAALLEILTGPSWESSGCAKCLYPPPTKAVS